MPYDKTKDFANTSPYASGARAAKKASKGKAIVPSDTVDLTAYAPLVVVVAAGNVVYIPTQNADADAVTITSAPVGYELPHQVRRVKATGTTATLATCEG